MAISAKDQLAAYIEGGDEEAKAEFALVAMELVKDVAAKISAQKQAMKNVHAQVNGQLLSLQIAEEQLQSIHMLKTEAEG